MLNGFIKSPVGPLVEPVAFGIVYNKPVKMSPIVVEMLNKTVECKKIHEKYGGFFINTRNNLTFIFLKE